jgi:1-acyl-sn-glycerol-3-phosphate acyltransferase
MAPMLLYPEGTVSNGDMLLTFKKGAFYGQRPLKVICTKYETNGFRPFTCSMKLMDI